LKWNLNLNGPPELKGLNPCHEFQLLWKGLPPPPCWLSASRGSSPSSNFFLISRKEVSKLTPKYFWVYRYRSIIPALRRERQEDKEFKVSMGYSKTLSQKN
jgi:hypothetical protein